MSNLAPAQPDLERLRSLHFSEDGTLKILQSAPSYFDVFGLPPLLTIDEEALREAFLLLSRLTHPDYFAGAAPELREESLRRSSLINNAWKTLRELPRRVEYLLSLLAPGLESSKNAVPPALLEEMFDIQEAGEGLREARLAADEAALAAAEARVLPLRMQVKETRAAVEEGLRQQAAALDAMLLSGTGEADREGTLRALRLSLDRLNYLRTVLRNLQ